MKFRRSGAAVVAMITVGFSFALAEGCGGDSEPASNGNLPEASTLDVANDSTFFDSPVYADAPADTGTITDAGADTGNPLPADAAAGVYPGCKDVRDLYPTAPSGTYMLDPDGPGGQAAFPVVCDMAADAGPWTLAFLKNTKGNANYSTFGSGYVNTDALAVHPKVASEADAGVADLAGWLDLNVLNYTEIVLESFVRGDSKFRSLPIAKSTLRIQFGQNGYLLYNDANGYYWCGGTAAYTDNGVGQVNKPDGGPDDCKGHGSLGNGFDFGGAIPNTNLTVCGLGISSLMFPGPSQPHINYGTPGGAIAFWVR